MSEPTVTFLVPEPVWVTLLAVWFVALGLAYLAGYCAGRWAEAKRISVNSNQNKP